MDEGLIARRYAKAVFRYAQELNAADAVYEKMKLFEKNYIAHPDLQKALLNPLLSPEDKEMLLSTAIGIEPGEAYIKGIRLLIRNHREMYLPDVSEDLPGCKRDYPGEDHHGDGVVGRDDG